MKRLLCLLMVILMVAALLVSCGGGGKDDDGDDGNNTPPVTDNGNNGNENENQTPDDGEDEGEDEIPEESWYDDVKFPKGTSITLQLSNLNDIELINGCQKYMEGPETQNDSGTGFEKVQNEVFKRNEAAKAALGLTVIYDYIAEDWGAGITTAIQQAEKSGNSPDMYCDMMYDMAGLTLQHEIFTNLLKYTQENKKNVLGWKEGAGYFALDSENGYNETLMEDMALTDDKMFLLASDYYMDVMRAMFVMPFNATLYKDYVNTSDPDAKEFYALVQRGEWTWDKLLTFNTVYGGGSSKASVNDDRMLMALSVSGLSGNGIVYSTAFKTYDYNETTGVYTLKSSCTELVNAFKAADKLSKENSIACGEATRGQPGGVEKCKEVFTSGRALFAGPQMLGVVEEAAYTQMEGLSIVPVPKTARMADYNTAINTRARVGALSYNSSKQKETSAWIQYCTETSEAVRTEYFENAMKSNYLSGSSGASDMLNLIYNSIGDSKSMVIDHLLLFKDWQNLHQYTWSQMIQDSDFTKHATTIQNTYTSAVQAKQSVLDEIMVAWNASDAYVPEN